MSKTEKDKVPVTVRALMQRVNRKLAKDDEMVRKSRPSYDRGVPIYHHDVGEFYRVDVRRNFMVEGDVALEKLAREIGALQPWEVLAQGVTS